MKKILTLVALIMATNFASAQSDAASKNVRFGLNVSPNIAWYSSGEKFTSSNGVGVKFGGGISVEFRLTNVASLATGLQINMDGGYVRYNNNMNSSFLTYYYNLQTDKITEYIATQQEIEATPSSSSKYQSYLLLDRKYSLTYITIPLTLKLKTKEIGAMTYYGQFGVNSSICVAAKATDNVQKFGVTGNNGLGTLETISKTDVSGDVNLFNEALNLGIGAEWNLAGTTSLNFGLSYLLGFTNVVTGQSDYLRKREVDTNGNTNDGSKLTQNLKSNSFVLTIGVLF